MHRVACPKPQSSGQTSTFFLFSFIEGQIYIVALLLSRLQFPYVTKHKLQRFEDLKTFDRVYQFPKKMLDELPPLKGNWNKEVFKRDAPIVLELGCGRGEYTIGLSKNDPSKNYIGVDIKGARLWRGAKTSHEEQLTHVAFIRTTIEFIYHFFSPHELSEIWITFPDPQPGLQREKRRLTHPNFLGMYQRLLKSGGVLHLKTDSDSFFEYTNEMLQSYEGELLFSTADLYASPPPGFDLGIKTTYEQKFLSKGMKISFLSFRFS
jgi:tRNA (guanine-N7-)-methyltransferase